MHLFGPFRGLTHARLTRHVRQLVRPSEIPQDRLRALVRDTERRPRVALPHEAPTSIAIVVPCFRHADFLRDTVDSILAQTRRPDEVIFVNDHSPDATTEILEALVAHHPDLARRHAELFVNDRNMGQAASLNRGISSASSDLIMILNDDDYLMQDAVAP